MQINQLQKLAGNLGISDSVTFLGRIKHEELPRFYNAADVCVVPSYYESCGLVALESLACGTPVVASDVGNLRDVIRQGQTGYVVADNTPQRLAEKITLVLSRVSGVESSRASRESVNRFSWHNIARAVAKKLQLARSNYHALVT